MEGTYGWLQAPATNEVADLGTAGNLLTFIRVSSLNAVIQ